MPRGSKPGERRGGRARGTRNKKTVLKDAVFCAAAANPDASPLDFMLGLMRDPNVPLDLRLDMAAAAAPFVHARPQAPPRVRTNPMDSRPLQGLPASLRAKLDGAQSSFDSSPPEMEAELMGPERAQENAVGNGVGGNGIGDSGLGGNGVGGNEGGDNGVGGNGVGGSGNGDKNGVGGNGVGGNGVGGNGVGGHSVDLTPLQFLLRVMKDPVATSQQRIRSARVAARYQHVTVPPDKMAAVDEYGFAISRTLANAIKEDWLELDRLGVSSKAAPKYFKIRARQAERDQFLRSPAGYSPKADQKRLGELDPDSLPRRLSMAEETELAFVIARITASEAAFNRSPEGQARRRMADLEYKREAANAERNRGVGLTRAEGKELDALVEQYRPAAPPPGPRVDSKVEAPGGAKAQGAAASNPDSEMEELGPTLNEMAARRSAERAELIARRKAAGDPDPWGGEAPTNTIYKLEGRLFLGEKLTAEEEKELQQIRRLYPKQVESNREFGEAADSHPAKDAGVRCSARHRSVSV